MRISSRRKEDSHMRAQLLLNAPRGSWIFHALRNEFFFSSGGVAIADEMRPGSR